MYMYGLLKILKKYFMWAKGVVIAIKGSTNEHMKLKKFVKCMILIHVLLDGLTEEQAIELESKEMTRTLNQTNDILTNRITPHLARRCNGYDRSPNTPALQFEITPYLYASEIDEHYFGIKHRRFDEVMDENLKSVVFITRNMRD